MASTKNAKKNHYSPLSPSPTLTSPTSNFNTLSISSFSSFDSSNREYHFFSQSWNNWSLIKFLKRKRPEHAKKNINWNEEYDIYRRHICALRFPDYRATLLKKFKKGDFNEHIFDMRFACP